MRPRGTEGAKVVYNDRQILAPKWIDESTSVQSRWGDRAYGYLWWILDGESKKYAAIGDGGSIIYISSEESLVVSIASRFKPRAKDRIEFIEKHIGPFFRAY